MRRTRRLDLGIACAALLLIASPLLLTRDGFAPDFTNDMWLAGYQQHALSSFLHPTLFLDTKQAGVFGPLFAFYGGSLFALTGFFGLLLGGSTELGYIFITLLGLAGAYGGLFWIARQLGARGWPAHAPALVFVTSAYYVTDLYGRGAWAEFMATSALPLLGAAALRLARGPWRAPEAVCLVAATVIFTGSHNITLLWGSTLAVLALVVYWLACGAPRVLAWRRIACVLGLMALAGGLNAWTLLPDVAYASRTLISARGITWSVTSFFNTFGVLLDPLRTVPLQSQTPALFVQLPVFALAWGLLCAPAVWGDRRLRAGFFTASAMILVLLGVVTASSLWRALPWPYRQAQYPYRLVSYLTLACAALVLIGVLALARRERARSFALGAVLIYGCAICAWQLWVPNTHIHGDHYSSYSNRSDALRGLPNSLPRSWNALDDYGDDTLRVTATGGSFSFDPAAVHDDRLSASVIFPPGTVPFVSNVVGGPYFVRVGGGVRTVGRTAGGNLVLKRKVQGSGPLPVTLAAAATAPVVLGRILSAVSFLGLLAVAGAGILRRRR